MVVQNMAAWDHGLASLPIGKLQTSSLKVLQLCLNVYEAVTISLNLIAVILIERLSSTLQFMQQQSWNTSQLVRDSLLSI